MTRKMEVPVQDFKALGASLGIELLVQRDDLLPFPLAGNKVRKVFAEIRNLAAMPDVLITNGGVDSNHCRTTAMIGALRGFRVHLVLHGDPTREVSDSKSLEMLNLLGATSQVVLPQDIRGAIDGALTRFRASGLACHVIAGGCHTPAGALSYRDAGLPVFNKLRPDFVFVASGTGATQGGLVAAAERAVSRPQVVGISVARTAERGIDAVKEAAAWAGAANAGIIFDDGYRSNGYGQSDELTWEAVQLGWRHGLPLDPTYTGKAFAGLLEYSRRGMLANRRVLFWHTGGLWNYLASEAMPSPSGHSKDMA